MPGSARRWKSRNYGCGRGHCERRTKRQSSVKKEEEEEEEKKVEMEAVKRQVCRTAPDREEERLALLGLRAPSCHEAAG